MKSNGKSTMASAFGIYYLRIQYNYIHVVFRFGCWGAGGQQQRLRRELPVQENRFFSVSFGMLLQTNPLRPTV
jgi:hypothetical protein